MYSLRARYHTQSTAHITLQQLYVSGQVWFFIHVMSGSGADAYFGKHLSVDGMYVVWTAIT